MKKINIYIIEKLHINKDIKIKDNSEKLAKIIMDIACLSDYLNKEEYDYCLKLISKYIKRNKITECVAYISGEDEILVKSIPIDYIDDYVVIDEEEYADISFKINEEGHYIYNNYSANISIKGALGQYIEIASTKNDAPEPILYELLD